MPLVALETCYHSWYGLAMLQAQSGIVQRHRFYVYELIGDDGKPFYVGRTGNPSKRLAQHLDPRYAHTAVHQRLVEQKAPRMRLVAGYNTLEEVIHAERVHIQSLPGLVNQLAGRRARGGTGLKVKFEPTTVVYMDSVRLTYSPPIDRGAYLSALLTLLRDKYPLIASEAAALAVTLRGDRIVVKIDELPPIDGCTEDVQPVMVGG